MTEHESLTSKLLLISGGCSNATKWSNPSLPETAVQGAARNHYLRHSGRALPMLVFPPGRSACDGDSLPGVRVDPRWVSFRPVRPGTGQGCGEPRCAGHPADTRRGWLRQRRFRGAPCARCAGTARHRHSVWDCVAGWSAWPCRAPGGVPRRRCGTRNRCRSGPPDDDLEGPGMFSKAARMFRAKGVVTGSAAIGLETGAGDRHPERTARFLPACNLFPRLSPACRECPMCLMVCTSADNRSAGCSGSGGGRFPASLHRRMARVMGNARLEI